MKEIVKLSLSATNDIVQLSREELTHSKNTEDHLKKLATLKKNWLDATDSYEVKLKSMKNYSSPPPETNQNSGGKVFVRANLDAA